MITDEQREARRKFIGASDSPAILGQSPYSTGWHVWASKVHGIDAPGNAATEAGIAAEPMVVDWVERRLGVALVRNTQYAIAIDGVPFGASLDAETDADPVETVEAKTTGLNGPPQHLDLWGPDGSDIVPPWVMIQVQHQLLVTGAGVGHVALLAGGHGFRLYTIERSMRLIEVIVERCSEWWVRHVVGKEAPPESPPIDIVRLLPRQRKVVAVDGLLVERCLDLKRMESFVAAERKKADAALLQAMGDADAAESDKGRAVFALVKRAGYTVEPGEYRRLLVRGPKDLAITGDHDDNAE